MNVSDVNGDEHISSFSMFLCQGLYTKQFFKTKAFSVPISLWFMQ